MTNLNFQVFVLSVCKVQDEDLLEVRNDDVGRSYFAIQLISEDLRDAGYQFEYFQLAEIVVLVLLHDGREKRHFGRSLFRVDDDKMVVNELDCEDVARCDATKQSSRIEIKAQ